MRKDLKEQFLDLWNSYYVSSKSSKTLMTRKGPVETKVSRFAHASARGAVWKFIEQKVLETAQEAYLECLREECGEGPCAEAIRTKFNLKL